MNDKPSIQSLEFLRGIAAVYVLVSHCRGRFFAGGQQVIASGDASLLDYLAIALLRFTSLGVEFVILFFVISGYSMAHSLRLTESYSAFYLKRLIRVWPPYVAAVAVAAVVAFAFAVDGFADPKRIAEIIFYANVSTVLTPQFWSLPYEIIFYAICPFVLLTKRRVSAFFMTSGVGATVFVLANGLMLNPADSLYMNFLGNEALFFAFGAYLYHNWERVPGAGPVLLTIVTVSTLISVSAINLFVFDDQANMPMAIVMLLLSGLVLRNLPELPEWTKPLNFGRFSYSIYIFHYAFIFALYELAYDLFGVRQQDMTSYWIWAVTVPPIMGACYVLYLFTERPCNELVGRIRRTSERVAVSKP